MVFGTGEGEPDFDFPAFERNKKLKDMNFSEFCLCEAGDDDDSDFPRAKGSGKNKTDGDSLNAEEEIPDGTIVLTIPNVGQMRIVYEDSCRFIDLLPKINTQQIKLK